MSIKRVTLAVMGLTALFVLAQATPVEARRIAKRGAAKLTTSDSAKTEAECCTPKEVCCPDPCIVYRHCGPKLCCTCDPPKEVVLQVEDPCTGCMVDVPICMPACCEGAPEVCHGTGLFCRDVVTYDWCCGFSVKVVFRKRGDLLVTTWGR